MPALPEFIPLEKNKAMYAVNWRDSPQTTAATQPTPSSAAPTPAAPCEKDGAAQGKSGGGRSRRGRRGRNRPSQRQQDADDFLVKCVLPKGVTFSKLMFELNYHESTPLHAYNIGLPHALLPRQNASAATAGAASAENCGPRSAVGAAAERQSDVAATAAGSGGADLGKKAKQGAANHSLACTPKTVTLSTKMAPVEDADESPSHLPDLFLPPSVPSEIILKGHLITLLFAESSEAEKVGELLQKKWPQATVMVVSRSRSILNASLVLKGLPSLAKTERIIEELETVLPHKPSYVRLHRGERGVFKNVVFVKYRTRDIAEECKLRLERFTIGSRLLKVEFKKKEKAAIEREKEVTLQQLVRDLRTSAEHEGFVYQRSDLTKDEIKLLKQLCNSYGHYFDLGEQTVTVKRVLPLSGRPSPAMRSTTTAQQVSSPQPTPLSLRPIDFKGSRFFSRVRGNQFVLDYVYAKNPGDVPSFAPGRGRPV